MGWLKSFDGWVRGICTTMGVVGAISIVFIQLITTADVILRDTITLPIKGTFELTQYAMVIAVFCAYGITQVKESHITVDVIARRLPGRTRAVLDAVLLFLALVFFVTAAWIGYDQTLVMMRRGAFSEVLAVVRWPFQGMVVVGFISLCLAIVRSFLFAVARALGKDVEAAPSRQGDISIV